MCDFKPEQIIVLMQQIGQTTVEVDNKLAPLRCAFCILQSAMVGGEADLICEMEPQPVADVEGR